MCTSEHQIPSRFQVAVSVHSQDQRCFQNVVRTKECHTSYFVSVSLIILPDFEVFCDLLLKWRSGKVGGPFPTQFFITIPSPVFLSQKSTLKSLISRKANKCILRYLNVLTSVFKGSCKKEIAFCTLVWWKKMIWQSWSRGFLKVFTLSCFC